MEVSPLTAQSKLAIHHKNMFTQSLAAWGKEEFAQVVCDEIKNSQLVPLVDLMQHGNAPVLASAHYSLLKAEEIEGQISVKLSVFFSSVVAGCQCADDPYPIAPIQEYAQIILSINRCDGSGSVVADPMYT